MHRLLAFVAVTLSTLALASSPIIVKVDGKVVKFPNMQPASIAGRTLVPLRGVFEAIGAYVEWNPQLRTVTARKQDEEVQLTIGTKIAKKNGAEIEIDVAPRVIRGTTMVPLRFISEALGASVNFDQGNNIVDISTGQ